MKFCESCGESVGLSARFCEHCGRGVGPTVQRPASAAETPGYHYAPPAPPRVPAPSQGMSTTGIILGVIAFLVLPIVLGPAAIILGAIAKSRGDERGVVAMAVGACGLIVGMFLGVLTASMG